MATLPTSEENARKILEIFEHFNTRSGEAVSAGSISGIAEKKKWRIDDINDGLVWGSEKGWFENKGNGSIMLTAEGFAEM